MNAHSTTDLLTFCYAVSMLAALAGLIGCVALIAACRQKRTRVIPPRFGFRDNNGPVRVR